MIRHVLILSLALVTLTSGLLEAKTRIRSKKTSIKKKLVKRYVRRSKSKIRPKRHNIGKKSKKTTRKRPRIIVRKAKIVAVKVPTIAPLVVIPEPQAIVQPTIIPLAEAAPAKVVPNSGTIDSIISTSASIVAVAKPIIASAIAISKPVISTALSYTANFIRTVASAAITKMNNYNQEQVESGVISPIVPSRPITNPSPSQPIAAHVVTAVPITTSNEECSICGLKESELGTGEATKTKCCNQFICKKDADSIEKHAQELHKNLQDPEWRKRTAAEPGFTGWPEGREHGKCPFCRHYPLETTLSSVAPIAQSTTTIAKKTCDVCLEDKAVSEYSKLTCGHEFCNGCLTSMLDLAIKEKSTTNLVCPSCRKKFTPQDIKKFTNNNRTKLDSYITIIKQEATAIPRTVNTVIDENDLSQVWIRDNAKRCPKCHVLCHKSEGCDHVQCNRCKFVFCWLCLDPLGDSFTHTRSAKHVQAFHEQERRNRSNRR